MHSGQLVCLLHICSEWMLESLLEYRKRNTPVFVDESILCFSLSLTWFCSLNGVLNPLNGVYGMPHYSLIWREKTFG